jgi:hypothetical protein
MFRIERKIVHVAAEKIITLFMRYKFTLNWKIVAVLFLMRKITQLQKNGKNYYLYFNY